MTDPDFEFLPMASGRQPDKHCVVMPLEEACRLSDDLVLYHAECVRDDGSEIVEGPFIIYLPIETKHVVHVSLDVVVSSSTISDE